MRQSFGIGWFAREILGQPLYPYQEEAGDAILDSILHKKGLTFSVMFARQMGKNQLSAIIEAYLLTCMETGSIVKAAPTFKPQIVNSRVRLLNMLDNELTRDRTWRAYGYMIGVAPDKAARDAQTGARIMFLSAGPEANIVGATASLLLEVDEAQDVSSEKFDRELRPMASTNDATTVLYGTAWSEATLLATTRASNLALEEQDGIKRHFEYDWRTLAAINPHYQHFVEGEIQRLGIDHPTIQTQYLLQPISGVGFLLNDLQRHLLRGTHSWQDEPEHDASDTFYVAGMDVGGEARPQQGQERAHADHDATVITIGRIRSNELLLPSLEIVHQYCWYGKDYLEQYAETVAICEQWNIRRLIIDKTGLGEMLASLLETKLGPDRVTPFHFTRPSKSALTYHFLSLINSGRLKLYQAAGAPGAIHGECWQQLRLTRYRIPGENLLDMYVDPTDGHDDYVISLALTCEALKERRGAIVESCVIRPRKLYDDGWY